MKLFSELKKAWKDTTTNTATGEYSQKRLMKWGAYATGLFMCLADVIELHFSHGFDINIRKPEPEIIGLLMLYAFVESAAIIAGKYMNRKTSDDNGNPLEPASPEQPKDESNA